jgi:hypothetical protein
MKCGLRWGDGCVSCTCTIGFSASAGEDIFRCKMSKKNTLAIIANEFLARD